MIPIEGVLERFGVEYDPERTGNQKVLCPFHDDTSPSASVNLDLGVFHCFGNQGCPEGDAIRLLELKEGLEFRDAKRLAEELAGGDRRSVPRKPDTRGSLLPRKSRAGSRSGGWKSPWSGR